MKYKVQILLAILLLSVWMVPIHSFAKGSATDDMIAANKFVTEALQASQQGKIDKTSDAFQRFSTTWLSIEAGIKEQSTTAYREIEDAMGQVQFALAQSPVKKKNVMAGLQQLRKTNEAFIKGKYPVTAQKGPATTANESDIAGLVTLLEASLKKIDAGNIAGAKADIEQFRKSWLVAEGAVLTQSAKVYGDAERDMVTSYAQLSSTKIEEAKKTIQGMRDYLAPLALKTSYNMLDATTIILREGLEALLVIVALMGFLKKAGHERKKRWIWMGVSVGIGVSILLGILVNVLFSAGTFGSNNFLIAGWTGVFAAVMLLYMSYWLHSKSSIAEWNRYIHDKSTKALHTGSLFSLAALAFLAVFREGTETVLFFIGMANAIKLSSLLLGIGIGVGVLIIVSYGILKVGVKIPMRPFFLGSSILMFYLCFKFAGMGIHGLQLAGLLPATEVTGLPTIDFLAFYPTVEGMISQGLLFCVAVVAIVLNKRKDKVLKHKQNNRIQGDFKHVNSN
ncbi:iron permease, FTR1 family protein [Fictibacillus macauensis ZFHKF-1]|uniref:Iron permease, FTR1 family protein n=1 Tax=Fictibacillus macauensis ZFHKF-1 TaxID=1196324 RepID=I8UEL7_9BACL|nr:FTR1 family protein [Fictibacillus macauensis]EIT85263.1 iron permease, FTR1 family protein [Fictibacillus macauensis ZFHKF-1]